MQEPNSGLPKSDFKVILFVIVLCFVCALLLAAAAYSLDSAQVQAKEFDQSKQMLIAAKILNHAGYFEILKDDGTVVTARFDPSKQILVEDPQALRATDAEIGLMAKLRIRPLVTDAAGNLFTLEEKNITLADYLSENKKSGYAHLPFKLFYAILPNKPEAQQLTAQEVAKDSKQATAFVIPISGFGLWAPIYGFLAIGPNGDEVIGTT